MRVCIFASSSDGNCLLVTQGKTNILIDAGISARRIVSALAQAQLTIGDIGGVLITHEHSDHICGLKTLLKKTDFKLYAPHTVANRVMGVLPDAIGRMNIIPVGEAFTLGELSVCAFHTSHDTDESVGYRLEGDGSFAVATDTGCITSEMYSALCGAEIILLESNHDEKMLCDGPYPVYLKKRILADTGHLSNADCAVFARWLAKSGTKKLVLGHLSRTNNTPELALTTVQRSLTGFDTALYCAPQLGFMELYTEEGSVCLQ